jgi:hypothetical protein
VRVRLIARSIGFVLLVGLTLFTIMQLSDRAKRSLPAASTPAVIGSLAPETLGDSDAPLTIFFDRETAPCCLASGWNKPEAGSGAWSSGALAVLRLPPMRTRKPVDIGLTLEAFVAPGLPAQTVKLRAGERTLAEWRLTSAGATRVDAVLPGDLPGRADGLDLQLDLPNATSPAHSVAGSTDVRILAVKLKALELKAAPGS